MSTKVTSIMVGNLTDNSPYLDHFVVELFEDSGLTELCAVATGAATLVSGVWTQQGVITFTGLSLGSTYYLRAGAVAPVSGLITWSSTFSIVAGSEVGPAPTYTFSTTQSGSGVSYVVTPASVPSNLDHYDAWWSLDGTVPTAASKAMWSGPLNNSATLSFFVGCAGAQTPYVYMRSVNTSQVAQAWTLLGSLSGGSLDNVVDGVDYIKLGNVASDHTLHTSLSFGPQGSLTNAGSWNTFTYAYTTTSITWSWTEFGIYAADGTSLTVAAGEASPITGLTADTEYYFEFYYDLSALEVVVVLSDVNSGKSPADLQMKMQIVNGDGHVALGVDITATTATSGGGGGGTGGGGGGGGGVLCFTPGTKVKTLFGPKAIADVRVGDRVRTARGTWRTVTHTTCTPYKGTMLHMDDPDNGVTPTHLFKRLWEWVPARACYADRYLYEGNIHNLHVDSAPEDDGTKPDTEHSYTLANGEVVHNMIT